MTCIESTDAAAAQGIHPNQGMGLGIDKSLHATAYVPDDHLYSSTTVYFQTMEAHRLRSFWNSENDKEAHPGYTIVNFQLSILPSLASSSGVATGGRAGGGPSRTTGFFHFFGVDNSISPFFWGGQNFFMFGWSGTIHSGIAPDSKSSRYATVLILRCHAERRINLIKKKKKKNFYETR